MLEMLHQLAARHSDRNRETSARRGHQAHWAGGHRQPAFRDARFKTSESLSVIMLKARLAAFAIGDGINPRLNLSSNKLCDMPRQRALMGYRVELRSQKVLIPTAPRR